MRAVLLGIVPGSAHRHRVDIAGGNARPQQSRRCNCKHAGAGADIEHIANAPAFRQIIQREEAATGRAVMTGAESEGGFDLDADVVGSQVGAVMRAMNDEAARRAPASSPARLLATQSAAGTRSMLSASAAASPGSQLDQIAQPDLVGSAAEMNRHLPASVIVLERGTGRILGIEGFAEIGRKTPGGRFVARQASDSGGRVHAAQDCPSHSCAQWLCRPL